jgi:hypothetical protein
LATFWTSSHVRNSADFSCSIFGRPHWCGLPSLKVPSSLCRDHGMTTHQRNVAAYWWHTVCRCCIL